MVFLRYLWSCVLSVLGLRPWGGFAVVLLVLGRLRRGSSAALAASVLGLGSFRGAPGFGGGPQGKRVASTLKRCSAAAYEIHAERRSFSTSGMMRMEMMTLASPNWTAALRACVSSLPVPSANFT